MLSKEERKEVERLAGEIARYSESVGMTGPVGATHRYYVSKQSDAESELRRYLDQITES